MAAGSQFAQPLTAIGLGGLGVLLILLGGLLLIGGGLERLWRRARFPVRRFPPPQLNLMDRLGIRCRRCAGVVAIGCFPDGLVR